MPYHEPEFEDPQELVGIELPGDEGVTREMAEAFADEFAQLGFSRAQILALYRAPFYEGAHRAWELLGEPEIARIVDESLAVWGRISACWMCQRRNPDRGRNRYSSFAGTVGSRGYVAGSRISDCGAINNGDRQKLADRPRHGVSVRSQISRAAVCVRLQHQPLHRMSELHDGVQINLDVQQGPGAHVVGQRRDQAVRRVPALVGRRGATEPNRPRDVRSAPGRAVFLPRSRCSWDAPEADQDAAP